MWVSLPGGLTARCVGPAGGAEAGRRPGVAPRPDGAARVRAAYGETAPAGGDRDGLLSGAAVHAVSTYLSTASLQEGGGVTFYLRGCHILHSALHVSPRGMLYVPVQVRDC